MVRTAPLRASLAALALVAAAGCSRDADFTVTKTFPVQTTANAYGPDAQEVDLAAEAGGAWDHRDKLRSVKLVGLTAIGKNIAPAGVTGSGTAWVRQGGADQLIASWQNVPMRDGAIVSLDSSPVLDGVLNEALKGDGRFTLILQGTSSANFTGQVEVSLHVEVEYRVP